MPERLNTTAEKLDSAVFSPGSEFYVQISAADSRAKLDVAGRVDASADWAVIATLSQNEPIGFFAALPFVKLSLRGNFDLKSAKAWSST